MTTEYAWRELREHAVELFGEAPRAETESRIIEVFSTHPQLVALGIDHVHDRWRAGVIRSPWPVLAKHVEDALSPLSDATATDSRDRDKAIRSAEQWMRAAGKHFDREPEVMEELFGELGRMPMFDSPELRERFGRLWRELRGEGERIEEQAEMRGRAWMAQRVAPKRPIDDPEPAAVDPDPEPVAA